MTNLTLCFQVTAQISGTLADNTFNADALYANLKAAFESGALSNALVAEGVSTGVSSAEGSVAAPPPPPSSEPGVFDDVVRVL